MDGNALCGSIFRVYANCGEDAVASDPTGKFVYLSANIYDTTTLGPDLLGPFPFGQLPIVARWQACDPETNGVDEIENNNSGMNVYPNPTNDFVHVEMNDVDVTEATLTILDVAGRIVFEKKIECPNKKHFHLSRFKQCEFWDVCDGIEGGGNFSCYKIVEAIIWSFTRFWAQG